MAGRLAARSPECYRDDLYQVALIAVWEASLGYDPGLGGEFVTFVKVCIRYDMLTFLRQERSRAPFASSLDEGIVSGLGEDEYMTRGDLVPNNRGYQVSESTQYLEHQIREMAPVSAQYFLDGYPQTEIAQRMGRSCDVVARKLAAERERLGRELDWSMAEEAARQRKGPRIYECPRFTPPSSKSQRKGVVRSEDN